MAKWSTNNLPAIFHSRNLFQNLFWNHVKIHVSKRNSRYVSNSYYKTMLRNMFPTTDLNIMLNLKWKNWELRDCPGLHGKTVVTVALTRTKLICRLNPSCFLLLWSVRGHKSFFFLLSWTSYTNLLTGLGASSCLILQHWQWEEKLPFWE